MVFIIVTATLALDQLTKFIAAKNLFYGHSVPVIKGFFHFTLIHNRGAAFGILKNQIPLFIFSSIIAAVLIFFELRSKKHRRLYEVALSLILAGALGNLIDRLLFGYVIDFLDFRVWPVFNIADSAVTVGAILLAWTIIRTKDQRPKTKNKKSLI
ncbi:MAG: signal peptidase II [Candidatus Omnitrophica bacterium]|nr:signal peptidase II [Candidatus Omnitrophota bacterium]MBU1870304.1 signal peptidase II [Candidatus Omnitrophota bacterium]